VPPHHFHILSMSLQHWHTLKLITWLHFPYPNRLVPTTSCKQSSSCIPRYTLYFIFMSLFIIITYISKLVYKNWPKIHTFELKEEKTDYINSMAVALAYLQSRDTLKITPNIFPYSSGGIKASSCQQFPRRWPSTRPNSSSVRFFQSRLHFIIRLQYHH
jgi:hypothetical protein